MRTKSSHPERVLLVSARLPQQSARAVEDSLDELAALVRTAGGEVVGRAVQRMPSPDPKYYLGRGKVRELCEDWGGASEDPVDLVVCDDPLSPAQEQNLADALGRRVIDRTGLILDIFAQRAHSREGKLQVELAQLTYLRTRLTGHGAQMSRLGGGIGTRGPGEMKLEIDRRRIDQRVARLRSEVDKLTAHRRRQRRRRHRRDMPTIALAGYTNAGKSTLLNALSGAEVFTEDLLFATLDPTTRRVFIPNPDTGAGMTVLVTDTVGFIHKLPHELVQAFASTFEEISDADVILHLVDYSHPAHDDQERTGEDTLSDMGLAEHPHFIVYTKCDDVAEPPHMGRGEALLVSARTGYGMDALRAAVWNYFHSVDAANAHPAETSSGAYGIHDGH